MEFGGNEWEMSVIVPSAKEGVEKGVCFEYA